MNKELCGSLSATFVEVLILLESAILTLMASGHRREALWGAGLMILAASMGATTLAGPAHAQFQWAERIAGTLNDNPELAIGMALDDQGNIYATGWFDGTNDFGGVNLISAGGQDVFVAKYDSTGALRWAQRAGGRTAGWDGGRGVGLDEAGNVYVTGQIVGPATFGDVNLSGSADDEFFLARYDRFGAIQWARQSVSETSVYGTGLAVDTAGNSYAVGYVSNRSGLRVTFGPVALLDSEASGYSAFLVKYNSGGTAQWAKLMGGPGQTYATKVALDGDGNVYVQGSFTETITIEDQKLVAAAGTQSLFIAKFDNTGRLKGKVQTAGGTVMEGGLVVDRSGNIYVSGGFGGTVNFGGPTLTSVGPNDAFLAKYSLFGTIRWVRQAGGAGAGFDLYADAALDSEGNVYAAGSLAADLAAPSGSGGAMVAKYDPAGTLQWTASANGPPGTPVGSIAAKVAVDLADNAYLAGWYQETLTAGPNVLKPQGRWNYFLAKVSPDGPPAVRGQPQSVTVGVGQSASFTAAAAGTPPLTYQWRKDGVVLPGQIAATLTLSDVQLSDAGSYDVVITNTFGTAFSSAAELTVLPLTLPVITSQPQSQNVNVGQNTSFSITATSALPFIYQWRREGTNLPGASSSFYSLPVVRPDQAGTYSVVVSNVAGSVTSSPPAVLTINPAAPGTVVAYTGRTSVPPGLSGVIAIAAGSSHIVALKSDGSVVVWGDNGSGKMRVPDGLNGIRAIAAGSYFTVALKSDGTVAAWGDDSGAGETTVPSSLNDVTAISAQSSCALALRRDGTVIAWGGDNSARHNADFAALGGVVGIAVGDGHALALKNDGTVVASGSGGYGQTTVPDGLNRVVAVAAGSRHSVALQSDGTVVAWGAGTTNSGNSHEFGQSIVPAGLSGVTAIAAAEDYTFAIRTDGTVVAWGSNRFDETTIPPGLSEVTAVAAGYLYTIALVPDVAPRISAHSSSNSLTVIWPNTAEPYRIESTLSLSPPFSWSNVTGAFQSNAVSISIVLSVSGTQGFYRLVKP